MNLTAALDRMVTTLRTHPRAQVFVEWKGPPLGRGLAPRIEERFARTLPADVAGFYGERNGYALLWGPRAGEPGTRTPRHLPRPGMRPDWSATFQDFGQRGGCMYLPPLEEVLLGDDLLYEFCGDPEDDTLLEVYGHAVREAELWRAVRPFDLAEGFFNGAFLLVEGEPFSTVVLDDQGACITDSRVTSFAEYLESCVSSLCDTAQRGKNFVMGSLQEKRVGAPPEGWPRLSVEDVLRRVARL